MFKYLLASFAICLLVAKPANTASQPTDPLLLAQQHIESDLDQAEAYIEQAMRQAPEDPEVYFVCGRIMGQQAEAAFFSAFSYAKSSLGCLKKAVELSPDTIKYRVALQTFYQEAPGIAGGDAGLAKEQVQLITRLDQLAGAKAEIQWLLSTENKAELQQRLLQFRQAFPMQAEFHYRHGLLLQEDKQFADAFTAFEQAILCFGQYPGPVNGLENDPKSDRHRFLLNALYQMGRNAVFSGQHVNEGIDALHAYAQLFMNDKQSPPIEWAYLRMAQLQHTLGDAGAVTQYSKLAAVSDDRDLHRALKKLNQRR